MSGIKLPQKDDREKRATELKKEAEFYAYNNDIGLPVIEKAGPADQNYRITLSKFLQK